GVATFDEPLARVRVLVHGGGELLTGAVVDVRREDGGSLSLRTAAGEALVLARPGERLALAVSSPGFEPEMREILAATSAEAFELRPEASLATLRVTLHSEDGVPLPAVCEFDLEPDRGFPSHRKAAVEDGGFVFRDLEPDGYRVVATLPGNFAPAAARVTLVRGETADLPLDILAGGRIVVRILTKGPLPDVWVEGAVDPRASKLPADVEWEAKGDTLESGLLPPGKYVLHVLAPDGPRSFPVEVKPAETLRLLVPLG
ncbi:MAG: carboxypeptidase-like regulatory domain-containing protein, partial [Planctomycetes bacterium]|nr:carboxypeptidase-like regulatory domain-containing protein [Planctomycetota bacterium]